MKSAHDYEKCGITKNVETTTMDHTRIDELRALADAATPGPWSYEGDLEPIEIYGFSDSPTHAVALVPRLEDAQFITCAREGVLRLLAHISDIERRIALRDKAFITEFDGSDPCRLCRRGKVSSGDTCHDCNDDYSGYEFDEARFSK